MLYWSRRTETQTSPRARRSAAHQAEAAMVDIACWRRSSMSSWRALFQSTSGEPCGRPRAIQWPCARAAISSSVGPVVLSRCRSAPGFGLALRPESPRGVVPDDAAPGTTRGAGEPLSPGLRAVDPAPAPAPDTTPDVSTPCPPTDRLASAAMVSLILSPFLGG